MGTYGLKKRQKTSVKKTGNSTFVRKNINFYEYIVQKSIFLGFGNPKSHLERIFVAP